VIVVDTSALMAIALDEPQADACIAVLESADQVLISAGTLAEALIVAGGKGIASVMAQTVETFRFTVAPVSEAGARRVAQAHARWGKGIHPASLNFGDCFAYALAKEQDCPLLYVGKDFARTDVQAVDFAGGGIG
jgi:ribonuclease VapC